MIDMRLRSQIAEEELQSKVGKLLTPADFNILLTGPATVRKPDGKLLCVYLPGRMKEELDRAYPTLHELKSATTTNRGNASGTVRLRRFKGTRTYTKPIASAIIGSFDPAGPKTYCRLTAWTGEQTEKFAGLRPLFQAMGREFQTAVPDRYAAQMEYVARTRAEWVIPGTPFSTITVNNTYPTGVHTDKGDLDAGFSCLAVLRRGDLTGGNLTFPKYRVSVDMRDGDLILMDAHEFHGNTVMQTFSEDAERISVVAYYRSKVVDCGSAAEELAKGRGRADSLLETAMRGVEVGE